MRYGCNKSMVTYPCERPALANLDDAALNMVELLCAHNIPLLVQHTKIHSPCCRTWLRTNDRLTDVQFHEALVRTSFNHARMHTRFSSVLAVVRMGDSSQGSARFALKDRKSLFHSRTERTKKKKKHAEVVTNGISESRTIDTRRMPSS